MCGRCSPNNNANAGEEKNGDLIATQEMCHYCFDVLLEKILRGSAHARRGIAKHAEDENTKGSNIREKGELVPRLHLSPEVECPLFVTWEKRRADGTPALSPISSGFTTPASSNLASDDDSSNEESAEYDLRGCIGTLAARPLVSALSEFAIASACRDKRFDPISLHELRELRVGVSLLVKYEECSNCFDWTVGTHGIIIKFDIRRGKGFEEHYSATYLPEVAFEQKWNQEEAVISLVRKAGYRGSIYDELLEQIQCTRYQSSKFRTSYQDYVVTKWHGDDPLSSVDVMTAAAVDEALRQKMKASKTSCDIL
jgi:uncharacterized protein (TIGR00296 family)